MIIVAIIAEKDEEESFLIGYLVILCRILCPHRNDGGGNGGRSKQCPSFLPVFSTRAINEVAEATTTVDGKVGRRRVRLFSPLPLPAVLWLH